DFVNEKGESDGFEVAVLKAVDELLPQYEFTFHGVSDDELLIGVETGKYQVGTKGAWITEERKKKFVIPQEPIGASVIGIAYRASDKDKITGLETLATYNGGGKLVPIAPQNAQYNIVQEYNQAHPDKQIKLLPSEIFEIADAYTWVLEGRYDAYFNIKLAFESNVLNEDAPYHKYADQLAYAPYKGIPTWPLFNIKEQEFADAYDGAIKTLREKGVIAELSNKYFGEDVFSFVTD
ncbi:MAG: transporter substrate-binding domain-containing protein, partial [Treponema sp.]|nr:transporter substrate-binding domain-containing protein [Treponema sp.]